MTETSDARLAQLRDWLKSELTVDATRVAHASVAASFRRYFRVWGESGTYIVMDASPERENVEPYVTVARMLAHIGVHVPKILAEARTQGFLLLTDLGTRVYLSELKNGSAHT